MVEVGACLAHGRGVLRRVALGPLHRDRRGAHLAVEHHRNVAIADRFVADLGLQRRQLHARTLLVRHRRGQLRQALLDEVVELAGGGDGVHQAPVHGALPLHAFRQGAEDVGVITAHAALVHHAGQAAGAGQHTQERHLRQAHRRGAVVHQQDLIACQGQLIATTCGDTVTRRQVVLSRVRTGVLDGQARLVGELAEVHLEGMSGRAEHVDVGSGGEDAILAGADGHRLHLGVLEAQPPDGIGKLDVHAQVVGVELEGVAGPQRFVLLHVPDQPGRLSVHLETPVAVVVRVGIEVDGVVAHAFFL